MESFIRKCVFGGMLGIVYDLCVFLFLKALLPTSVLDTVLIAAPILFAAGSMLTGVTVVAEEHACSEKCFSDLGIHVFVLVVTVTVGILLFYFRIISSIAAIVLIGFFSIIIVEMLYRPEILLRWNKFCAVFAVVFVIPVCMVYLALLAKSLLIFMLLLIVSAMLLIDTYYYN